MTIDATMHAILRHCRISQYIALVVLAEITIPWARAGLNWDATVINRQAKVGEDHLQVEFPFSNPGRQPITIIDVKPTCGCTATALDRKTYGPGEKGTLTAILDTKDLSGVNEKTIEVLTDDSPKPIILTLRATIPPWIDVFPRLLWWSIGEERKAKEAIITLNHEAAVKITSVKVDNPTVSISLKPEDSAGHYRLIAKPASTAAPMQTTVTLALEVSISQRRTYVVFVQVR